MISFGSYAQSKITQHLEFGKYTVGYLVIHTYDNSRSFFTKYDYYGHRTGNPIGRPIQVSIWYPARKENLSNAMSYQDYIGYTASEIDFEKNDVYSYFEFRRGKCSEPKGTLKNQLNS